MSLRASQRQLAARLSEGVPSGKEGTKPGGKAPRAKKQRKPPAHPLSAVEKAQRAKAKTDKTAQNLRILLSQ